MSSSGTFEHPNPGAGHRRRRRLSDKTTRETLASENRKTHSHPQTRKGPTSIRMSGLNEKNSATSYSPTSKERSTIGAEGVHCRVRDGNGCSTFAIATENRISIRIILFQRDKLERSRMVARE